MDVGRQLSLFELHGALIDNPHPIWSKGDQGNGSYRSGAAGGSINYTLVGCAHQKIEKMASSGISSYPKTALRWNRSSRSCLHEHFWIQSNTFLYILTGATKVGNKGSFTPEI